MAHYAKAENNSLVEQVLVVNNEDTFDSNGQESEIVGNTFLNNLLGGNSQWLKTSYNTRGGIHYQSDNNTPSEDQSKAFRKNFAQIGYTYDEQRDAFIPPKPYPSWILDEFSCLWNPPISYPNDNQNYYWNENDLTWKLIENI